MDNADFIKPSQSPIYDPAVATAFFEAAGAVADVAAGTEFFVERQARSFFSRDDRMYLLLEGAVAISIGRRSIDTVKAGEIFGEMATITDSPRSATATAKSACRVIALDGGQFQTAIEKNPGFALMLMSIIIDRLRLTLARLTMMKARPDAVAGDERRVFDDETLDAIAHELGDPPMSIFAKGKTIISAGEAGTLMYLLREGSVAISAGDRLLERVGVGGVFGEMALVDRAKRVATAVADTECVCLTVNRQQFLEMVQTKPAFGLSLLKVLGQRLRDATSQTAK